MDIHSSEHSDCKWEQGTKWHLDYTPATNCDFGQPSNICEPTFSSEKKNKKSEL